MPKSLHSVVLMKKPVLIPLIASSVLWGCQDSTQNSPEQKTQKDTVAVQKVTVAKWVGEYQGTTPCLSCSSRCEECLGMAVDLVLNSNNTYTLKRESLSGNDKKHVIYTGQFQWRNRDQSKLELMQVNARHLIYVDLEQQQLEILQDQTENIYASEDDFILIKQT